MWMDSTGSKCPTAAASGVAPFVWKTYQMVNDPFTNSIISWGQHNNSFVVSDPLLFSQKLLPAHFKHSNFSSFVRQLNTYGFRKVDPDRWEFAHAFFLRGQKDLLSSILRRKTLRPKAELGHSNSGGEEPARKAVFSELARLKLDQTALEEELQGISRRLQATEKKPRQIMAFLTRVAEDPGLLSRIIPRKKDPAAKILPVPEKKRQRMVEISAPDERVGVVPAGNGSVGSAPAAAAGLTYWNGIGLLDDHWFVSDSIAVPTASAEKDGTGEQFVFLPEWGTATATGVEDAAAASLCSGY